MEKQFIGAVDEKQLAEWKQTHKEVYTIEVDGEDNKVHVGYLKKPDITDLSETSRKSLVITEEGEIQQNVVEAGICFIDLCWIGGDNTIRTDDDLLYAVSQKVQSIYKTKEVRLKKN